MRWSPEDEERLAVLAKDGLSASAVADALNRTEGGVYAKAAAIGVTFSSTTHRGLTDHIEAGGAVMREDCGGSVGIRWTDAARTGATYATAICERLVQLGKLKPLPERTHIFYGA